MHIKDLLQISFPWLFVNDMILIHCMLCSFYSYY